MSYWKTTFNCDKCNKVVSEIRHTIMGEPLICEDCRREEDRETKQKGDNDGK